MARRKNEPEPSGAELSFEEALAGLEAIVEAMERESLPLEELVAGYEKGSVLLERCESVLSSARERIELITLRNKGGTAADASAPATERDGLFPPSALADDNDDDDDIRLF